MRLVKGTLAAIISLWTGLHWAMQLLIYAMAIDIATGIVASWVDRTIDSDISRRGIGRKVLVLLAVMGAEVIGRHVGVDVSTPWGSSWGIGAAVAAYYAIHEAISITENLGRAGVPLPPFIMERLAQLRDAMERKQ